MSKYYDGNITSKHTDWGGDESTNNLPVRGSKIQEFIKSTFDNKIGCLYYDQTNNRYIAFADKENRDAYLADPTLTSYVLGTFDAPFNYSAAITLTSSSYVALLAGSTGQYIDFTFDTLNKQGQSVGEDVIVTFAFIKNGNKTVVSQKVRYGSSVHFNADAYLSTGTNTVIVGISGVNTLAATTVGITYNVIDLSLSDSLDISKVYDLSNGKTAVAAIPYTVSGQGTKEMEFYLDGILLDYVKVEDEVVDVTASRTKYITLTNLSQGIHSLQFRGYVTINGEKFYSDILYRDLIVYTGVDKNPIIALQATVPVGNAVVSGVLGIWDITQYVPYEIKFAIYNPIGAAQTEAVITVDSKEQARIMTSNSQVVSYSLRASVYGAKTMTITAGSSIHSATLNIAVTTMNISEIKDGLVLSLSAVGKSNLDKDKESWVFGSYSAAFSGFKWNQQSGWNGNRLRISKGASVTVSFAPFSSDVTSTGATMEFEFATRDVTDDDAVICDLRGSNGAGLLLTASKATLVSSSGKSVSTYYKALDNNRITFVINKKTGVSRKLMMLLFINGEDSGSVNFGSGDTFTNSASIVVGGTSLATVDLKEIRIYSAALTDEQVLNNYIISRDTVDDMMSVYDRNDVYDEGTLNFSTDKLAAFAPVMIVTGDVAALENTTDKNKTIYVDINYINFQDTTLSFTAKGAKMKPQGTSSMGYPKKNFRIYTNVGTMYDYKGNVIEKGAYAFKANAQKVSCWCLKADYAESSGTHNTGIARLWNQVMYGAQLGGAYVLRTQAQKAALASKYAYDVRTTVDGFPITMFYRPSDAANLIFLGKYNFNNDKSTESVFGFKDIPGFDNAKMQCWEVLNNGHHLCNFKDTANFDTEWTDAWEARYPDKCKETADLKDIAMWISSTRHESDTVYNSSQITISGEVKKDEDLQYGSSDKYVANGSYEDTATNRQNKFSREKWDYLDVYKVAAYYIYLMRFGAVDQPVKNSMWTSEGINGVGTHCKWFFINYDNDTINGLVNDGFQVVPWNALRSTVDTRYTDTTYFFAGHDSTLWNNLEADDEFMRIVADIDAALYQAGLNYDKVCDMFDVQQAGKWCERVFNQDAQYKYIGPYTDSGINNLFMLQGSRTSQRRWWLNKRFSLFDSKFVSGEYKAKSLEFKCANAPAGVKFSIMAGVPLYYGYGINNVPQETGIVLGKDDSHTFTTKSVLNVGDPVRIYSAFNLKELNLSNLMKYLSTLTITEVYNEISGSNLRKLVIGSSTDTNSSLSDISGIAKAVNLEYLDIQNMRGVVSLDLSENVNIETLIATGSGLMGVTFAKGAPVKTIAFPASVNVLDLEHLPNLANSGLSITGGSAAISAVTIKDCTSFDSKAWLTDWMSVKTTANKDCTVNIEGIAWMSVTADFMLSIGKIKTEGGDLSLRGCVELTNITLEQAKLLKVIYGENCFAKDRELYFKVPDSIFISGPTTVASGNSAQYSLDVYLNDPNNIGTTSYCLYENGEVKTDNGVTIDVNTGLLVSTLQTSEFVVTVRGKHTCKDGTIFIKDINVTFSPPVYPRDISITGPKAIDTIGAYNYTVTMGNKSLVTGSYDVVWSVAPNSISNFVELVNLSSECCTLKVKSLPADNTTVKIIISYEVDATVKSTGSVTLSLVLPGVIMTNSSNAEVLAVCKAQGWCASDKYMLKSEAESVKSIGTYFNSCQMTQFDEFKYFTGITNIDGNYAFCYCQSMKSITLPNSLVRVDGKGVFGDCAKLEKIIIPSKCVYLFSSLFDHCDSLKSIYCYALQAPYCFDNAFGSEDYNYAGNKTRNTGENKLFVPANSTGYDTGPWLETLCDTSKCGFTLYKTL